MCSLFFVFVGMRIEDSAKDSYFTEPYDKGLSGKVKKYFLLLSPRSFEILDIFGSQIKIIKFILLFVAWQFPVNDPCVASPL